MRNRRGNYFTAQPYRQGDNFLTCSNSKPLAVSIHIHYFTQLQRLREPWPQKRDDFVFTGLHVYTAYVISRCILLNSILTVTFLYQGTPDLTRHLFWKAASLTILGWKTDLAQVGGNCNTGKCGKGKTQRQVNLMTTLEPGKIKVGRVHWTEKRSP